MLGSIIIDSFQRIPEANINLAGNSIHVFSGNNEAGKSSLLEAVAFALRGLSPRVKLKGQFEELIFGGKKNGSVALTMDGFDIHRAIKTGKLSTTAPLDYPELLVDIQLGREKFGRSDEKVLRKMLMTVFGVESSGEYVSQRLKARGIDDVIIKQCIPLLAAGGFSSAHTAATEKQTELRAQWKEVAGEVYGSEKAQDWKPADMANFPEVKDEDVVEAKRYAEELKVTRDATQKAIGALESVSKRAESLNVTESLEDLQGHLGRLTTEQQQINDDLTKERANLESEIESCNVEIEKLKSQIDTAKMAASTLECPACAKPLVLHTENNAVRLVSAETPRRDGPSLDSLVAELRDTKSVKDDATAKRTVRIRALEARFNQHTRDVAVVGEKIKLLTDDSAKVTAEDVTKAQTEAEQAEAAYQEALSRVTKLDSGKQERSKRIQKQIRAKQINLELGQWTTVATALGNSQDSIPSELLQKTIGPINDQMIKISQKFCSQPIVVDSSMHLSRGDGTAYYMLSESAQWRADVCVQLALAALSKLKLVAIDRFDVLEPVARPLFFDMLEWYAQEHKDVTVLCTGTLKARPDFGEGIKSWWIEEGRVTE